VQHHGEAGSLLASPDGRGFSLGFSEDADSNDDAEAELAAARKPDGPSPRPIGSNLAVSDDPDGASRTPPVRRKVAKTPRTPPVPTATALEGKIHRVDPKFAS
jgi:hypothetical protein